MSDTKTEVVILAAGRGKRMHSELPKVLHPVLYRPMLHYVLDAAFALPHGGVTVVVGYGEKEVRERCGEYEGVKFALQAEPKGTADAVRAAKGELQGKTGSVVILSGDVILLRQQTLEQLLEKHNRRKAVCTAVTAKLDQPKGYGRILRDDQGKMCAIREELDCSETERALNEVNAGVYCFDIPSLLEALDKVDSHNQQGEFYLTDVVAALAGAHPGKLATLRLEDPDEMTGINDRLALWEVERKLQGRVNRELMLSGVRMQNPDSIFVDTKSRISPEVILEQGCYIMSSVIEKGAIIESHSRVVNSYIGEASHIKQGSYITDSQVGKSCHVGPYAHFRPATRLGADVKIGNFVEVKKSQFRDGAKASHLSYIGDAEIGAGANLGCGFITCNYDGVNKHKTIVEDGVFVGSDSQTVAPVTIGAGAYIASGTTVTRNVPADALAISRGKMVVKEGYAVRFRKGKTPTVE